MDQHHGTVATPNVLEHNGIACMHIEASLEHADQILVQIHVEQVTCIAGRLVEEPVRLVLEKATVDQASGAESVVEEAPDAFVQSLLVFLS